MSLFYGVNRLQWPILYLSQNRHVVLPVFLRALRACCVEEIHLLHVLALGAHEGLHVLDPFPHVLIGPLIDFGKEGAGDSCHRRVWNVFGYLNVHIGSPQGVFVRQNHLSRRFGIEGFDRLHVALHHAPEVQRDVEETRHAVFHKPLAFPCECRFVPWGGIELRTAFIFHCFIFSFLANVDVMSPRLRDDLDLGLRC